MFPIVITVSIGASKLANKCILFHTDNQGLVEVINKKTTKDKRLLVLLKHNVLFRAVHVSRVLNVKADALSRLHVRPLGNVIGRCTLCDGANLRTLENLSNDCNFCRIIYSC